MCLDQCCCMLLSHIFNSSILIAHRFFIYIHRERERIPQHKHSRQNTNDIQSHFAGLFPISFHTKWEVLQKVVSVIGGDLENIWALRVWFLVPQKPLESRWLFRESSVSVHRSCCSNAIAECFFEATQIEDVKKIQIKNSLVSAISSHGLLHFFTSLHSM
jgi:hypothetical protein